MHIGRYGDGRLTIENGGKVSGRSQVGMFAGATGLAIVRGAESSWTLSGQNIGGIGTGTVRVRIVPFEQSPHGYVRLRFLRSR